MIILEELNVDNWLETMELSVSEEQKNVFPIPNVYWVGISRYEEKGSSHENAELLAFKEISR